MGRRERTPNEALSGLMRVGNIENAQLARQVNRVGAERGLRLGYDKSSVSHWRRGAVPKPAVRPVLLEALSRLLGRPVTSAEVGLGGCGPAGSPDVVTGVVELGRADMDPSRRAVLGAGLYSAVAAIPSFDDVRGAERIAASRTARIGAADVVTVRRMTEHVAGILDELGGAHARPMAGAFLVNTVAPYLGAAGTDAVQRQMRSAAADLVYLAGWMAMYERDHARGQRHYVQALRLAGQADDHVTYCRTLRGMALQASNLRFGRRALELADSAAEAAPAAGPRLTAFLRGQQAHGAAMVGDRRQALLRLRETEDALGRADGHNDAVGGYDRAAYEFHVGHVLWELGDQAGSVRALRRSNAARPAHERQGRVHATGLLASRLMTMRHVEEACGVWQGFLDDYAGIASARGDEHFARLRASVRPYGAIPAVRDLAERARQVALLKAA